ncbi:hypothetical protein Q31b_55420 [Novipirellula aureliae]|uniref:Uncharacterized protein n=1 Tax=Novipirellula aureliae TaxID=2527966 RepID=A0A5C6DFK5_9BACT|nr:PEP-CTERM sorting domain-containing protein [Novipirellula aureliae]TWU34587.1 hypothetical protein Q31b_55420 [Novipirellula aureliae]
MKRHRLLSIGIPVFVALLAIPAVQAKADVVFNFDNNTEFDGNVGIGMMMSATSTTAPDIGDTVTITTVDAYAPVYTDPFDGTTTGTVTATTNIGSNAIGINNPTYSNNAYDTLTGQTADESGDFNPGEAWVIEFDKNVMITEFNFSSIDGVDEFFDVTVEGNPTVFSFTDGTSGDDFADPLSGLVVAAGTDVTFAARGTIGGTNIRISEISVTVVAIPEPSSLAVLGLGGMMMFVRRRDA